MVVTQSFSGSPSHIELESKRSSGAGKHCGDKLGLYEKEEGDKLVYRQLHNRDALTHFYLYRYISNCIIQQIVRVLLTFRQIYLSLF